MNSNTVVAIVDPYSSGLPLAREVKARGNTCLMVQSQDEAPAMYRSSFHPEDFDAVIQHVGDLEETIAALRVRKVGCVIAGCELGVELADRISERLGLASNGTALSKARRNKRLMGEMLRKGGVCTPAEFSTGQLEGALDWIRLQSGWPVVLKPLCSSGSDGVSLCNNETELRHAFEGVISHDDAFGSTNDAVLIQEFLRGTEYAVDTVSCAGRHKVAAFWEYGKPAAVSSFLGNDSCELVPYNQPLADRLFPCVTGALDALEIKYGPAHCELIWSDDGPVIVEVGARLNGGNNPLLSQICGGSSQIDLTLDAFLEPACFLAELGEPYALSKRAMRVFLTPRQKGRLISITRREEIERLQSFHDMHVSSPGKVVSRIAGWVVLVHEERDVIHHDLQQIRRLELEGLYQIEPEI